jgi:predicted nucleic acid-binding protein
MGTKFLMDTNAVSDYLVAKLPASGIIFMDTLVDAGPNLSVMSRIELVGYNAPIAQTYRDFVAIAHVYDLTESIILRTIELRRSRRIKVPDAIIAATALVYDLTLITHNLSDFETIPGLKLVDAYQI